MAWFSDFQILYHLLLKPIRGRDHAERMERFYQGQAAAYDRFRQRLLHGRRQLFEAISAPFGGVWVDLGGGTAANLEWIPRLDRLGKVYVVDLSSSLLDVARRRVEEHGWTNVELVQADATTFQPAEGQVDVVTFSYSLTMIPDWFAAVDNAWAMLGPGGTIGVVDFYVSRKYPLEGMVRHGWLARWFWPTWFASDNVFLSPDHVPYLHRRFNALRLIESRAPIPYLPFARVPNYIFIGQKRSPNGKPAIR